MINNNLALSVKVLREYLKLSQKEFGKKLNKTLVDINRYENKRVSIPSDLVINIVNEWPQVNADWLLTGRGDMLITDNKTDQSPKLPGKKIKYWKNVHFTAGHGGILDVPEEWDWVSIPDFFMRNENPDMINMVKVYGNSMEPELEEGSFVLFKNNGQYADGKINVLQVNGKQYIKRVKQIDSDTMCLVSTNVPEGVQPWIIKMGDNFTIFGEVILNIKTI